MPWPCSGPHSRVRRMSMSKVPWSSSMRGSSGGFAIAVGSLQPLDVDCLQLVPPPSLACDPARATARQAIALVHDLLSAEHDQGDRAEDGKFEREDGRAGAARPVELVQPREQRAGAAGQKSRLDVVQMH